MQLPKKVVRVFLDERRNHFRLGCLICEDAGKEHLFTRTISALKKQYRLSLHAHTDAKDKHKKAAIGLVCSQIAVSHADKAFSYMEFAGEEEDAYMALFSFLANKFKERSVHIFSDAVTLPIGVHDFVKDACARNNWQYEMYNKNNSPLLVCVTDYILYYDLVKQLK